MPVFRSKGAFGRLGFPDDVYSAWKRWFAWYPVSDMGRTYWFVWVEWRRVKSHGTLAAHKIMANYVEYRLVGETECEQL